MSTLSLSAITLSAVKPIISHGTDTPEAREKKRANQRFAQLNSMASRHNLFGVGAGSSFKTPDAMDFFSPSKPIQQNEGYNDCFFLSSLEVARRNSKLQDILLKNVVQLGKGDYAVIMPNGELKRVNLEHLPTNPDTHYRSLGPDGILVLEAAYRDWSFQQQRSVSDLHSADFQVSGYSSDVFNTLLPGVSQTRTTGFYEDASGWERMTGSGEMWTRPLARKPIAAQAVKALLLEKEKNPGLLMTAYSLNYQSEDPHLSRSKTMRHRKNNGEYRSIYRIKQHEFRPKHLYSVDSVSRDKKGNLQVTVINPDGPLHHGMVGDPNYKKTLTLAEFLSAFRAVDATTLSA